MNSSKNALKKSERIILFFSSVEKLKVRIVLKQGKKELSQKLNRILDKYRQLRLQKQEY